MSTTLLQYTVPQGWCPEGTEWEPHLFFWDGPELLTSEGMRPTILLRRISCWPMRIDTSPLGMPGDYWVTEGQFISMPGSFALVARKTIYGEKVLITLEAVPNDTQDI